MDDNYQVTTGCDAAHPDRRGGQHVAQTCVAVRILHKPTGIAVTCMGERSQLRCREKAFSMLCKLLDEEGVTP